jgi:hypothetical protein
VNRRLIARLARLEQAVPKVVDAPECRHHGTTCGMGVTWPQPYVHDQQDELLEWLADIRGDLGPSRRERWAINVHERVPAAEIAQRERELAELIAEQEAKNERILAELLDDRT